MLFYRHFNFLHLLSLPNASNRFLSLCFLSHPFPTMLNESPKVKPLSAGGWNQWELEMSSWLRFKGWWGYIYSAGIGAVDFVLLVNGVAQRPIRFTRVLHVPDLRNNLLSVIFLARSKRFEIRIFGESIRFLLQGKLLFTASISDDNAAYLDGFTPETKSSLPLVAAP